MHNKPQLSIISHLMPLVARATFHVGRERISSQQQGFNELVSGVLCTELHEAHSYSPAVLKTRRSPVKVYVSDSRDALVSRVVHHSQSASPPLTYCPLGVSRPVWTSMADSGFEGQGDCGSLTGVADSLNPWGLQLCVQSRLQSRMVRNIKCPAGDIFFLSPFL